MKMKNNSTFLSHKKEICLRAKSKIRRLMMKLT